MGDLIVLWDKISLLGASVIERIDESDRRKRRFRCPHCGQTGFKRRSGLLPLHRCADCHHEFDDPVVEELDVHGYETTHGAAWLNLEGLLSGSTLRDICTQPRSMHSIRELDWLGFKEALVRVEPAAPLRLLEATSAIVSQGHAPELARLRPGKRDLRLDLLRSFGDVCAITGPVPAAALDAARLCVYSGSRTYDEHGALLLRRDVYRLLDLGLVCVEPDRLAIEPYPSGEGRMARRTRVADHRRSHAGP